MRSTGARLVLITCACVLLAACTVSAQNGSPTAAQQATRSGRLTPFVTPSPLATDAPTSAPSATHTPAAPTSTPVTHVVQQGEDMTGIAIRYGVGLAELTSANPTVNPNLMSIGTVLIIPASTMPTAPVTAEQSIAVTPTAIPVQTGPVTCSRARDGGIWCFRMLRNNQEFTLESLTGVFYLRDNQGETLTQEAALPLDTLPAGASLPLAAYFAPEAAASIPEPFQAGSELLTSLPNPDDGRYIPSQVQNPQVFISVDGLTAEILLEVALTAEGQQANRVWVAAVAYDAQGQVVGLRRWENTGTVPLRSGETLPVKMMVYSTGSAIQRVELLSEARP